MVSSLLNPDTSSEISHSSFLDYSLSQMIAILATTPLQRMVLFETSTLNCPIFGV